MEQTLDDVTARWNLLQHSFYQRWTRGALTRDELSDYTSSARLSESARTKFVCVSSAQTTGAA
jgi:hypothetical protein